MRKTVFMVGAICLALSLAGTLEASDVRLYRFVNADGSLVISHTIPANKVAGGYDILDAATGRLLERVPAQLTAEQLALKEARDRERQACLEDLDRVQTLYSSESEIDRALREALASIDSRIKNAEANLTQLRFEQRKLEREAAQIERTGGTLSDILVNNIERTQIQIDTLKGEVAQRHRDKVGARERFAEDLEIFRNGRCPEMVANF
jgi:hypothetical protein